MVRQEICHLACHVVQNLGLQEISSRGHCGHSPPYASQGVSLHQSREVRQEYPVYVCRGDSGGSYAFRLEQQLYRAVWEPYAESLAGEMAPAHVAHPGGKAGIATFRREMSPSCKKRIPQILQTCRSHMAFQEAVSILRSRVLEG